MILRHVRVILGLLVLASGTALAEWQIETVDSEGNVGEVTSLALDTQGYPHIAYVEGVSYTDIKYCFRDAAGWHIETTGSAGSAYGGALALDQAGYAHIACFWFDGSLSVSVLHQITTDWQVDEVAPLTYVGLQLPISLALDEADRGHVSWSESVGSTLKQIVYYAHKEETSWVVETVTSGVVMPYPYQSLALDLAGTPHLAYCDGDSVRYASREAGQWVTETVESGTQSPQFAHCSLALASDDAPHIGYLDMRNWLLKYAHREGSNWVVETIDSDGGAFASLALDQVGYAHIAYMGNGDLYDLKYARQSSSGWRLETVDSGPEETGSSSLALVAEGLAQISYYDHTKGDLKYAREVRPIEIALSMPGSTFGEGDPCSLDLSAHNLGAERTVDLYVLLDVFGSYWCYPSWQPLAEGLDHQALTVPAGDSNLTLIPEFTMPAVSAGGPFYFYAAMFEPGTLSLETLVSNGAVWQFGLE